MSERQPFESGFKSTILLIAKNATTDVSLFDNTSFSLFFSVRSLPLETIGGRTAEVGQSRGRSRVFLRRYVFVDSSTARGTSRAA